MLPPLRPGLPSFPAASRQMRTKPPALRCAPPMGSNPGSPGIPIPPLPLATDVDLMVGGAYAHQERVAEPMTPVMPSLNRYYRGSWAAPCEARAPVLSYNPFTRKVVGFEAQWIGTARLEQTLAHYFVPTSVRSAHRPGGGDKRCWRPLSST